MIKKVEVLVTMEGSKLLISSYKDKYLAVYYKGDKAYDIEVLDKDVRMLDSIHIAKVGNIADNISAAFLDIVNPSNKDERLKAYYSLTDNKRHIYTDFSEHERFKQNDEILVQITKEAAKGKACIASSNISLSAVYTVLSLGQGKVTFSSKIDDKAWKEEIKSELIKYLDKDFNLVLRTNSYKVKNELIQKELLLLSEEMKKLLEKARHTKAPALIKLSDKEYINLLKQYLNGELKEIITDIDEVFEDISAYLKDSDKSKIPSCRLYKDELLPLNKLYALDSLIEGVKQRKVWLKNGAYIVMDYTEAMTVIDVNTGKTDINKSAQETVYYTNLEAAKEIARQLRLRNISGIVIIDFIDMKSKELRDKLFNKLNKELKEDKVRARAIDYTALNLVELTRQKIKKPLYEVL